MFFKIKITYFNINIFSLIITDILLILFMEKNIRCLYKSIKIYTYRKIKSIYIIIKYLPNYYLLSLY